MKAIVIDDFGGADQLHMADVPTPQPDENEVRIHIAYTSVNPVDWKIREGYLKHLFPHEFPLIPGWDAAGTISKVGKNVNKFKVGDEVYSYCRKPIVQWGTYTEYICFDVNDVALKPKNLSMAQAASIPLVGLTAWQALFDVAKLKAGENVLIHAGAGGVGSLAIGLAKNAGAKVFTTASEKNHDYVRKLGADEPIDYKKFDFVDKMHEILPHGADVVFDCVGSDTLQRSFDVIKIGGRLVSIVEKIDPKKAAERHIQSTTVLVRPNGEQLQKIAELIEQEKILPPHIEEMPLKDAAKAQEKNRGRHTCGKIVLCI